MDNDIRNIVTMNRLITYFVNVLNWNVDIDDFEDVEDISFEFEAADLGIKEEEFAKIKSLRQLQPFVDGQRWGIFSVEFDSKKFEISALRKVLSALIPKKRNSADHAVWDQSDLLFICFWGEDNNRTIGIAHFEEKDRGLPQIKMIYCAPAIEDTMHIQTFETQLKNLTWPVDVHDEKKWHDDWSKAFVTGYRQTIHDVSTLTIQLAYEARNISDRILEALKVETDEGYVHQLYEKFTDTLVHDMSENQFADMYAQTVVYGLFSARCMDETQDDFSASEAVECIPSTNPFLKSLMQECLGAQTNSKLSFDELEIGNVVDLLLHTKTDSIIQDFNRQTGGGKEDPVIHFYEEFLTAYDKDQKVQRGVFYTPQPVVSFIVRAVDDLIRSEFNLEDGLASISTRKIKVKQLSTRKVNGYYKTIEVPQDVPRIQILDPATGTGTFLRQIIIQVYNDLRSNFPTLSREEFIKIWNEYVPTNLLERMTGFELMMAPYAVAHMKLAMVLADSGYKFKSNQRLQVYLTNTLEEAGNASAQLSLFDDPLATEAIDANDKKKNKKISIVLGNPPYSGESANKNDWITNLMEDYKKEPGGVIKLNERNPKWLNDDYVKFIRYAQMLIQRTGDGIMAYICPHGFLDNPTFRGMRWSLLRAFSKIYIIDLHGNVNKHEVSPDGSKDENVFDIQQGVCIILAVRNTSSALLADVYHSQIYGTREKKYDLLRKARIQDIIFEKVKYTEPQYLFIQKNSEGEDEYNNFFSLKELFPLNSMGVVTAKDKILVGFTREELIKQVSDYYRIAPDENKIFPINYRPFDNRFVYYDTKLIERSRKDVMVNFAGNENVGLVFRRQSPDAMPIVYFYICDAMMADGYIRSDNKGGETVAPLYIYDNSLLGKRKYNLSGEIVHEFEKILGIKLTDTCENNKSTCFSGEDLICYIYAILYSPSYRKKYGVFIKTDYPRIPYPKDVVSFWNYVELGKKLKDIHLQRVSESSIDYIKYYGTEGSVIDTRKHDGDRVYINKTDYFSPVTEQTWNAYLGGYQPLQKWLKDRKGKEINKYEINTFRLLIFALNMTEKIQNEIEQFEA